jgi:hypothetical protein
MAIMNREKVFFFNLNFNKGILNFKKEGERLKNNRIILNNSSILNRYVEQVYFFIKLYLSINSNKIFFIILSGIKNKLIFPFPLFQQNYNNFSFKIKSKMKYIICEEIEISKQEEKIMKFKQFTRWFFFKNLYGSIFYIYTYLKKKYKSESFRIFTINPEKIYFSDIRKYKRIISIGKNLNGVLDFLVHSQNFYLYWYFSFLTKGIYCKTKKNLKNLIYSSDLLNMLFIILSYSNGSSEFFIGNNVSKIYPKKNHFLLSVATSHHWSCSFCLAQYSIIFSQCFVCGGLKIFLM